MRYFIVSMLVIIWLVVAGIDCRGSEYIQIGRQSKTNPYSEAKKLREAQNRLEIAEVKFQDRLFYSRERQQIRETQLYDQMSLTYLKFEMSYPQHVTNYSSRVGRVRDVYRVR